MASLGYALGRLFLIWFAIAFIGGGLWILIQVLLGKHQTKETVIKIVVIALCAGLVVGIAFDFLLGPGPDGSSIVKTVWKWFLEILNATNTSITG